MKILTLFSLVALVAIGCKSVSTTTATTTTSTTSTTTSTSANTATTTATVVGQWDYQISGTPEGDFTGILTVKPVSSNLNALMSTGGGELEFTSFQFNPTTKVATGEFNYSGTTVTFEATVSGDTMNGEVMAGGMRFPFKGTRKK